MTTPLRRLFALIGTAAAGWIGGYVVADAPTTFDADGGMAATRNAVPVASKANDRDDEATAFRTALAGAFQELRPLARRRGFVAAIAAAPIEALPAAVKMLLLLDDEEASEYTGLLFARWAELDPVQAAQYAAPFSDDYRLDEALDAVMKTWVATAPAAAEQWVRGLPNGAATVRFVEALISNVAATDPRRALGLIQEMGARDGKHPVLDAGSWPSLYRNVFSELGNRDGKSAVKEALSLPVGAARSAAIEGALSSWSARDFH